MALHPALPPTPVTAPQRGADVPQEGGPQEPSLGFFQQPSVQTVVPFVTSVMIHAGILILGIAAVRLFASRVVPGIIEKEQTIIPEATPALGPPGAIPNVGPHNDPFKEAIQDQSPEGGKPTGWADKAAPTLEIMTGGAGAGESGPSSLIGLGAISPGSGKNAGGGAGNTSGGGTGDGSGPLAMFGAPGGGAIGPRGPVFGDGGNARRIVFVCDATGSMFNKMAILKAELQDAVNSLKPFQSFNIIFYYDGPKVQAADMSELLPATLDSKRNAFKFLDDVTATGQTDPIPAIQLAFGQHPDLIYLLSDGGLDDNLRTNKEVTDELDHLNPGHKVKINTIMFDSYQAEAEAVMSKIAKDTGGKYRYVKESDLNR